MGHYTGRFAPSPSGSLHFGSLVAAVASYLDARAHNGRWLLRIDDLDPPREVSGASGQIIAGLRHHGLDWDGDICWQSQRSMAYQAALAQLERAGLSYACDCSRTTLAATGGVYRGHCSKRCLQPLPGRATRIRVRSEPIEFYDLVQGPQSQRLDREPGDFVIRRKDGLFAYQLAVVVDDAAQGVNCVIRGADLLDSTARQIYLQQQLGLATPVYGHVPVANNSDGQKLSKQNLARELNNGTAVDNVLAAMHFLGQQLPSCNFTEPRQVLRWAALRWQRHNIPRCMAINHPPP